MAIDQPGPGCIPLAGLYTTMPGQDLTARKVETLACPMPLSIMSAREVQRPRPCTRVPAQVYRSGLSSAACRS